MTDISRDQLSAYVDGALPPAEARAVEQALAESAPLKAEWEQIQRLRSLLKEAPPPTPPADFMGRVLERLQPRRSHWVWATPLIGAGAAAMVMVWVYHDTDRTGHPDTVSVAPAVSDREVSRPLALKISPQESVEQLGKSSMEPQTDIRRRTPASDRSAAQDSTEALEPQSLRGAGSMAPGAHPGPTAGTIAQPLSNHAAKGLSVSREMRLESTAVAGGARAQPAGDEWSGVYSAIDTPQQAVARSADEWKNLWDSLWAHKIPPPPVPEVDFSMHMVVGVFQGTKPSSGYRVTIDRVTEGDTALEVVYRDTVPDPSLAHLDVITSPYHLRRVPATPKPVRFIKK